MASTDQRRRRRRRAVLTARRCDNTGDDVRWNRIGE